MFIMARYRPFCTLVSQPNQTPSGGPGFICATGQVFIWDYPSATSTDRSPKAFQSSTHNVVRASCFEALSACVEARKLFLDGSLRLAGRWPWSGCLGSSSWRQRYALLATFRRT